MTSHQAEHDSVRQAIGQHIIAFAAAHTGSHFHMEELTRYVRQRVPTAPDSAGRILRALRQAGKINYRLVSRHDSEYLIVSVRTDAPAPRQLSLV